MYEPNDFSDAEYAGKRKQTRYERFWAEMEQVPWAGLRALIEQLTPKPVMIGHRAL